MERTLRKELETSRTRIRQMHILRDKGELLVRQLVKNIKTKDSLLRDKDELIRTLEKNIETNDLLLHDKDELIRTLQRNNKTNSSLLQDADQSISTYKDAVHALSDINICIDITLYEKEEEIRKHCEREKDLREEMERQAKNHQECTDMNVELKGALVDKDEIIRSLHTTVGDQKVELEILRGRRSALEEPLNGADEPMEGIEADHQEPGRVEHQYRAPTACMWTKTAPRRRIQVHERMDVEEGVDVADSVGSENGLHGTTAPSNTPITKTRMQMQIDPYNTKGLHDKMEAPKRISREPKRYGNYVQTTAGHRKRRERRREKHPNQHRKQSPKERPQERLQERSQERLEERLQERSQERLQERLQERSQERLQDRSQERLQEHSREGSRELDIFSEDLSENWEEEDEKQIAADWEEQHEKEMSNYREEDGEKR